MSIPGIERPLDITEARIESIARKYLYAAQEAGRIYRHLEAAKGKGNFVTEVSMDETDQPQTPGELFFILAALAQEKLPVQTIAPKFTGRFNKGVDYVGDVNQFEKEFNDDLSVIAFAIKKFGLPADLKLSVHCGSDKFSIYPAIRRAIRKHGAGLHIKTAGTTWLEELIGLATAGGEGLQIAKDVYRQALDRFDELCGPYATVIDIDKSKLPSPDEVAGWTGEQFASPPARAEKAIQCELPPTAARRLQGRGPDGGSIYPRAGGIRADDRGERDGKYFDRHLKPIFIERRVLFSDTGFIPCVQDVLPYGT